MGSIPTTHPLPHVAFLGVSDSHLLSDSPSPLTPLPCPKVAGTVLATPMAVLTAPPNTPQNLQGHMTLIL